MNETTLKIKLLELAREVAWDLNSANDFNELSAEDFNYFIERLQVEYEKLHEPTDEVIMNIGRREGGVNY